MNRKQGRKRVDEKEIHDISAMKGQELSEVRSVEYGPCAVADSRSVCGR